MLHKFVKFVHRFSVLDLAGIAGLGMLTGIMTSYTLKHFSQRSVKQKLTQYPAYREPIKLLRSNEGAQYLLGSNFNIGVSKLNYLNSMYTLKQAKADSTKIVLLLKNPQFLSNYYVTL